MKRKTRTCSTGHGTGLIMPESPSWPPPTSPGAVKVTGISGWREVVQANTALGDYANRLREERKVLDARLIAEKERVANLAAKNRALQEQVDRGLIGKIARVLNTDVRRVFGLRKSGNR